MKQANTDKINPVAERAHEDYFAAMRRKFGREPLLRLSWINIAVLLAVLAAFFGGSLLMEKQKFSEIEKRELTKFPEFSATALFSGEFNRGIEQWFSDTFPFRDGFVSLSAVLDESRGVRMDDVRIIEPSGGEAPPASPSDAPESKNSLFAPQPNGTPETPQGALPGAAGESSDNSANDDSSGAEGVKDGSGEAEKPSADDGVTGAINNGTFVYKGRAMSLFGGGSELGKQYAAAVNSYRDELPGVQIYDMIIPTSIEFYVPEKYRDLTEPQSALIDTVYSSLADGIKTVDAYSKLAEHTDEYIYFRTDHHWTGLGAYYAYTAFCEQAGLIPKQLSDFETRRLDDFIGTMYAQAKRDPTLLENPDFVDYYIIPQEHTVEKYAPGAPYTPIGWSLWGEYAQSPNSYSVFLHGDFPLVKVKTGLDTGRKIMVVKESFGNAFAPFLISHYDEVYIVDQRYFELPAIDFIKENGITELLFANNSFAVCTPYHIQCIDNMRHNAG